MLPRCILVHKYTFLVCLSYLRVQQQRVAVWQTETDRKSHFGWAVEFIIDLEGNFIKVADGSCVQFQNKVSTY